MSAVLENAIDDGASWLASHATDEHPQPDFAGGNCDDYLPNDLVGNAKLPYQLPERIGEGGRNIELRRYACSLHAHHVPQEEVERRVLEVNAERCDPPLDEAEVLKVARPLDDVVVRLVHSSDAGVLAGEAPEVRPPELKNTDLALSGLAVRALKEKFRFDHSARRWVTYTRGAWSACRKGEQIEKMKRVPAAVFTLLGAVVARDPEGRAAKQLQGLAQRAQSAAGMKAALELAASDPALAVTAEQFDRDPDLFNAANGVIDTRARALLAHAPEQMLAHQSPVPYDPEAQCPQFDAFLFQISMGDPGWVDYMQRVCGYLLTGNVGEEKLFFWFGTGANGKSVLANLIEYVMGAYCTTAPAAMFMAAKRDGEAATPMLASLPGKRCLLANETESGAMLSAQTVKVVTSTESISARHLHGAPFAFKPTHKTIIRGNHLPAVREVDEGTWRRIDLVPFDLRLQPHQRDHGLEARLKTEASGILAWMVRGAIEWRRRGLTPCARVAAASAQYRREQDTVGLWLSECATVGGGFSVTKQAAYDNYRQWAYRDGHQAKSKRTLTVSLCDRGFGVGRLSTGTRAETYTGFRLI